MGEAEIDRLSSVKEESVYGVRPTRTVSSLSHACRGASLVCLERALFTLSIHATRVYLWFRAVCTVVRWSVMMAQGYGQCLSSSSTSIASNSEDVQTSISATMSASSSMLDERVADESLNASTTVHADAPTQQRDAQCVLCLKTVLTELSATGDVEMAVFGKARLLLWAYHASFFTHHTYLSLEVAFVSIRVVHMVVYAKIDWEHACIYICCNRRDALYVWYIIYLSAKIAL